MTYSPTLIFFIACGFLSMWLSFSLAYLMLKSWQTVREDYLLGFPVGFSLLALAYAMTDIAYVIALTNSWGLMQLFLSTWGFAFLAVTYFLRSASRAGKGGAAHLAFATLGGLMVATLAAVFLMPVEFLPPHASAELAFRVVNLILLGYVIFNLNKALKVETGLSTVVLGFTFLTIDQFSLLANTLDRIFVWAIIFAQLVRVVGLLILTVFLVKSFERRMHR